MTKEWDAQRDQRSYLKFLEHYEAAGLLSCECSAQWQIMGEKLSRKRVTKTTQYQEISGKKVNWEMTDRCTLLSDALCNNMSLKDGGRRLAIIITSRFSSSELNRRIVQELPADTDKYSKADFIGALEAVSRECNHPSEIMHSSFNKAEFHTVRRMTANYARDWFNKAIQICKLVSDRLQLRVNRRHRVRKSAQPDD